MIIIVLTDWVKILKFNLKEKDITYIWRLRWFSFTGFLQFFDVLYPHRRHKYSFNFAFIHLLTQHIKTIFLVNKVNLKFSLSYKKSMWYLFKLSLENLFFVYISYSKLRKDFYQLHRPKFHRNIYGNLINYYKICAQIKLKKIFSCFYVKL